MISNRRSCVCVCIWCVCVCVCMCGCVCVCVYGEIFKSPCQICFERKGSVARDHLVSPPLLLVCIRGDRTTTTTSKAAAFFSSIRGRYRVIKTRRFFFKPYSVNVACTFTLSVNGSARRLERVKPAVVHA